LAVLTEPPPRFGIGVGQQLVEQVHEPVGDTDQAFCPEGQQRRVATLVARLSERLVRGCLCPAGENRDPFGRQDTQVPLAGTEVPQERQLVDLVVEHPGRSLHWEVPQPGRPSHPEAGVDPEQPVELATPLCTQQRGDPTRCLLTSRLPSCAHQGLLERRQPRTDEPELVEPFARHVEQHDRAVLDQGLCCQPVA
jgi:hypothetical protein